MYECDVCSAEFYYLDCFEDHLDCYDHWLECQTCSKQFRTARACGQHMNDTAHWAPTFECETCDREFSSQHAANKHMNAANHWAPEFECETCDRKFSSHHAVEQHMDATNHWEPTFECETCDRVFTSQHAVDQHMNATGHWRLYYTQCDRHFMNENNLKMHLNSRTHRGSTIACPFCKTAYTTASGVIHHLESGTCTSAPQLNRDTILRMVRERDPKRLITTRALEYYESGSPLYTATKYAYNGDAWECYLCHREFNSAQSLNSHINSPVHRSKVYRCPNRSRCGREFTTLAGFFGHLESETCSFMRFEKVQAQVGHVLRGNKTIAFG